MEHVQGIEEFNQCIINDYMASPMNQPCRIKVVDFYSTSCDPCMKMLMILPNLERDLRGDASFWKVDVDLNPDVYAMYNVTKVPTFLFFKDGIEVDRIVGVTLMKNIKEKVETLSK